MVLSQSDVRLVWECDSLTMVAVVLLAPMSKIM